MGQYREQFQELGHERNELGSPRYGTPRHGNRQDTNMSGIPSSVQGGVTEESLGGLLKVVSNEISEGRCNASRRSLFMQLLSKVNFAAIELNDYNWEYLIAGLRFVANQDDHEESKAALTLFSEIIQKRTYDISRIMAILN